MTKKFQFQEKQLTFDNAYCVYKLIMKWLFQQKTSQISLDLSKIDYIDSAGVAILVELKRITHVDLKKNLILKCSDQIMQMIGFYELDCLLEKIDE